MPLVSSFWLSKKKKNRKAWVEPVVDREKKEIHFEVRKGDGVAPDPPKVGQGVKFKCLVCNQMAEEQYIKAEGKAGRMGQELMSVVVEGRGGRSYLQPKEGDVAISR